jgi:DeoR/GlpR family transcriptional regulator of sugar metabolism
MKVFFCHASRHKSLVREVIKDLERPLQAWLDDEDLLLGEDLSTVLQQVIQAETDYLVVFMDQYFFRSKWLRRELNWALEQETELNRVFVLPVIIEPGPSSRSMPQSIQGRKQLRLHEHSAGAVHSLAKDLSEQVVGWMSRELRPQAAPTVQEKANVQEPSLLSPLEYIRKGEEYIQKAARALRVVLHPHRRENPLTLDEVYVRLRDTEGFPTTREEFDQLLERLEEKRYLAGLVISGDKIFLKEELFGWKLSSFTDAKQRIAKVAFTQTYHGARILLDAGSTTIEIARLISQAFRLSQLKRLTVVTNSVPAANLLLMTASALGLEDANDVLQVYIVGGRVRANTLAIVSEVGLGSKAILGGVPEIVEILGGADMAFVGTNGIDEDGFSTISSAETRMKQDMLRLASKKFIVGDASKFGIRQDIVFAGFDEDIELITTKEQFELTVDRYIEFFKNRKTKVTIAD